MAHYHYTASGLANVWLANGYRFVETPYGDAVEIDRVEALHRAIGLAICRKPVTNGRELRYLRTELDLSQGELGKLFGKTDQTIAIWEKGRDVPRWADTLVRALYRERIEGRVKLAEIFATSEKVIGNSRSTRLTFHKSANGAWTPVTSPVRAAA